MTHIYIGSDRIAGPRDLFFKRLSALEVSETFDAKLTPRRLDEWRTRSPRGFAFVMHALRGVTHPIEDEALLPPALREQELGAFGLLRDTDSVRAAWAQTVALAEKLAPKIILLETPMEFSPSMRHRQHLEWFVRELAPQWRGAIAWRPHGLWELEEAVSLSRHLGLVPVFDPFEELELPPDHGTVLFQLYERRGLRSRFDEFDMEELLDRCEPYQRAIIIFKGVNRYRDARLAHTTWEARRGEGALEEEG